MKLTRLTWTRDGRKCLRLYTKKVTRGVVRLRLDGFANSAFLHHQHRGRDGGLVRLGAHRGGSRDVEFTRRRRHRRRHEYGVNHTLSSTSILKRRRRHASCRADGVSADAQRQFLFSVKSIRKIKKVPRACSRFFFPTFTAGGWRACQACFVIKGQSFFRVRFARPPQPSSSPHH